MTQKQEVGRLGEQEAVEHLIKKSYKIIERNYRKKWGELDIVAKAPDKTLVFVEVKAGGGYPFNPEENLTKAKLRKLQRTALIYANKRLDLVSDQQGWRIDLVAVDWSRGPEPEIRHYENI